MASSTPTKRDADGNGNAKKAMKPIILKRPGFENDIRLKVFGQEYHAHSIILKLHSAYFRKFLDSADKVPAAETSLFSYDYVSVVDDDREWGLEAVKLFHKDSSTNEVKAPRTERSGRRAFNALLFAFYNIPYTIGSYDCFMDIYRLADFYCALPAFSHSLDSALHRSPIFTESIRRNSKSLLRIAKKLHHPVLFRECLIYQVAEIECFHKRESWISKFDDDKELKLSFMMALTRVRSLQDYIDQSIISSAEEVPSFRNFLTERGEVMWREGSYDAAGYRTLLNRLQDRNQEHMVGLALLLEWLPKLLTSNVVLDRSGARVGDIGPDGDDDDESFFCAQIRDADLPWDQGSIDW